MPGPTDDQPGPAEDAIDPTIDDSVAAEEIAASEAIRAVEDVAAARRRGPSDPGWLRVVIVVWCFWLLGAWGAAWLSDTSVPRVRWMMFAGSFGLMLAWPAFRLSQQVRSDEPGHGALQVLLDWLAMIGVYQAVIWSLHLLAAWPLIRGVWLDAAVMAWSLLTALIVAAARRWPYGWARTAAMALCIALVFAEPVVLWLVVISGGEAWPMRVSPIQAFWELTKPPSRGTIQPWDKRTLMIAFVAVSGWLSLWLWWVGERVALLRDAKA
ncbi:MAG: hypothetical protein KTR15_08660 [Phycisphaeraceae bacterium]|nr:hypothetical protein [Phycisphaeraceae bacterium]